MRTYAELIQIADFEERLNYAYIGGGIGDETFGYNRYLNQLLYHTPEWASVRRKIILRDDGNDLAFKDRPIFKGIVIHHLEPITAQDILERADKVFDPNNLVCVSGDIHRYIHYGIPEERIPHRDRFPGDTCPWR